MAYWACAQLVPQHETFAINMLARAEFTVYAPKLREWRVTKRQGVQPREHWLFPGYCFLLVVSGWWNARWAPGVVRLYGWSAPGEGS